MLTVITFAILPVALLLPSPPPDPNPTPPHIFQALNCMGHNGAGVNTFYGTIPGDCTQAKIFQKPVTKSAQIITAPPLHPLETVHCTVTVKIFTATCGISKSTNSRNYYLNNKEVVNEVFSPTPEECFKANRTSKLTWIVPPAGSYQGEEVTSQLVEGRARGKYYPYKQRPGSFGCTGYTWLDGRGKAHLNAALEVVYDIVVRSRWVTYNMDEGTVVVPQLVSFHMSEANKFERKVPPPPKPAVRHRDVHVKDPERIRVLEIVSRVATPEQMKVLFSDKPGNDRNIKSIAQDPFKADLVDTIMDPFYQNFSAGAQEFREREWAKRDLDNQITWFADITYGLFVIQTQSIPVTKCDSARIITQTTQGELFQSNNRKFDNVFRFQDLQTHIGLAASLGEEVTLCDRKVNSLHRAHVFILIVDTVNQFLQIPPAEDEFLSPEIKTQSKIISLTATSTLNIVGMHEAMDHRACELHKNTLKNSLSLITHDMQQVQDSNGSPMLTFTRGEAVYAVECQKEDVIARATEGICCDELPVFTKDKETGAFSVEMFMAPFTRRISNFCTPTPCVSTYPSFHNVSSPTETAYYKVSNGIPTLTTDIPMPLSPTGINSSYLQPHLQDSILTEEQEKGITRIIQTGQARAAVIATAALGVVTSFHSWLAPIIQPIKTEVPQDFMTAFETVFSDGPIPGLLGNFPYYIQIALGIVTLILLAWAGSHLAFLAVAFIKTARDSIRDAFLTTVAPTIGLKRAINFTNEQKKINEDHKGSIQQVSDTTQQMQIQNNFFKTYVTETLQQQQNEIDYLKSNCTCKQRTNNCDPTPSCT